MSGLEGAAGYATAAAIASAVAGTTTGIISENNRRRDVVRQTKEKMRQEEKRRKNILEEQLARRRASIGSIGLSSTGSVLSSQNKLISDSYKNIGSVFPENDTLHYARISNDLFSGINSITKTIK